MKTIGLLILALFACGAGITAQTADDVQYGGGGGPIPALLFLDLDELNEAVTAAGYPQIRPVLFAMGGGGYGGVLTGIRVGGFGVAGDSLSTSGQRSVSMDLGYGGVIVEKAADTDREFTVVLGTMLGGGSLDLRFISDLPTTFEEAVARPFVSSMSKGFFAVQPYVAFESQMAPWMWARFQLGFLWTLTDRWAFEDATFAGPPRTLNGLVASLILRFGGTSVVEPAETGQEPAVSAEEAAPSEVPSPEEAGT